MSFKIKTHSQYKVVAENLEIFRGVKDIYPSQVNHRFDGDGVFGKGTYYALNQSVAEQYASGAIGLEPFERFALVFGYHVTPKNPLELTPEVADGLQMHSNTIKLDPDVAEEAGMNESFARDHLGNFALQSEFDCVILRDGDGMIDGEEQMLIPKGSKLKPVPQWVDVILNDEDDDLAHAIAKTLKGNVSYENGMATVVNIPLTKLKELSKLLEKTSNSSEFDGKPAEDDED